MNQSGVLFGIAAAISWSIGIFPFTEASRRLGANPLNHVRLLMATVLLGLTSILINVSGFYDLFNDHYFLAWIWLGLSGVIGLALGDYFAFKMYAILGANKGSVLTTFAPAAALICGIYFLDEKINSIGILGILITMTGVIAISFGKKARMNMVANKHGKIGNGVLLGLLAAVCQGVGLVFAKKSFLIQNELNCPISPVNATFIRMVISTGFLYSMTLISGKKREVLEPLLANKENGLKFAFAGAFFGPFLAVCLSLQTITKLDVAVAQTIFSLVPAFTLVISFFFLKEKITLQSFAGIIISIIGVFILIWRNSLHNFILE